MSFFSNLFAPSRTASEKVIIGHIESGISFMTGKGRYDVPKETQFEAQIIATLFFLRIVKGTLPYKFDKIEKISMDYLMENGNKLKYKLQIGLSDFIIRRSHEYSDELNPFLENFNRGMVASKTAYYVLQNPLSLKEGQNLDLMACTVVMQGFGAFINFTKEVIHDIDTLV